MGVIQFLCVLTSTCLAPYLPPTNILRMSRLHWVPSGVALCGHSGRPFRGQWRCKSQIPAWPSRRSPGEMLGCSLKCHTGGLGSCLTLVWLRMQLPFFPACLVGIKWFCLKVSCFARPIFPGALRENGLWLWLMWPALSISKVLASSATGIPEAKINPGHIMVCLQGPAVSGQAPFSQPLRTSYVCFMENVKVFSCAWWEEYRKVCLLHIPGSEALKAPL